MMNKTTQFISAFTLTIISWFLFGAVYHAAWLLVNAAFELSNIHLPTIGYWSFVLLSGVISTLRSGNVNIKMNEQLENKSVKTTHAWSVVFTKFVTQMVFILMLTIIALILL